jgi:hypothetical protein
MKQKLNGHIILVLCCSICLVMTIACSPKFIVRGHMVQGRVLDTDTGMPPADAAVAIRWIAANDRRDSAFRIPASIRRQPPGLDR